LLIIINSESPLASLKKRERFVKMMRLFPHRGFGLDIIVLTEPEVKTIIDENEGEWDLVLEILADGKTLYERRAEN
jgi:hypothetical protein